LSLPLAFAAGIIFAEIGTDASDAVVIAALLAAVSLCGWPLLARIALSRANRYLACGAAAIFIAGGLASDCGIRALLALRCLSPRPLRREARVGCGG
jgi:hypothetical protein